MALTQRYFHLSSLSGVPYILHADASSFFSAQGAEKLIADHIQLLLINSLHAQLLFLQLLHTLV